jgi:hypothetical protein
MKVKFFLGDLGKRNGGSTKEMADQQKKWQIFFGDLGKGNGWRGNRQELVYYVPLSQGFGGGKRVPPSVCVSRKSLWNF